MKGEFSKLRSELFAEAVQLQISSSTIRESCKLRTLASPDRTTSHRRAPVAVVERLGETTRPSS